MWAWEIGAAIEREEAAADFNDEEWFSCEEWVDEDAEPDVEGCITPTCRTESISRLTPRTDRQNQGIELTEFSTGAPQVPLSGRAVTADTRGAEWTAAHVFEFPVCWLCGQKGCSCFVRHRKKKKQRRQRERRQRGISTAAEASFSRQWEEAVGVVRQGIGAKAGWLKVMQRWRSVQTGRAQARILRVVSKAAVLKQFSEVYYKQKREHERDVVVVRSAEVGCQVRSTGIQTSKEVQCEVHTVEMGQQTEDSEFGVSEMVSVAAQTEAQVEVAQREKTEQGCVMAREKNPAMELVLSEVVVSNVENAVFRATLHSERDGTEVTESVLLDRYREEVQFAEVAVAELEGIKALLLCEYTRAKMESQIEGAASRKRQVHVPGGSLSEKTKQENSEMGERSGMEEQHRPDKTALLLKSVVRKDREIRSKEPKIPWQ